MDDNLFGEESDKPEVKPTQVNKNNDLFGEELVKPVKQLRKDDDLFGDMSKTVKPIKKVKKSDDKVTVGKPVKKTTEQVDDDLFGDEPPKPVTQPPPLSADLFDVKEDKPPVKKPPTEEEEEDLFASLDPTPKRKAVIKERAKPVEDDLFDEPKKETTPTTAPQPELKSIFTDAPDINKETPAEESSKKTEDDPDVTLS